MAKEIKKTWYKSKTLWINVLVIAGGILAALEADVQAGLTISTIGVLNLVLRLITKQALKQ